MHNLILGCVLFISLSLPAASQGLDENERIIFYTDGLVDPIIDAAQDQLKDDLKKRNIEWDIEVQKKGLLKEIEKEFDKNVLKEAPQVVFISFGIYDICDPKKFDLNEYKLDTMIAALDAVVQKCKAKDVRVVIATPGLAGETLGDAHQTHIDTLAERLRSYAAEQQLKVCDLRGQALAWLKKNPPKKSGRLQLSKKGGKWDDLGAELFAAEIMKSIGLSQSGIQRAIKWDEKVVLGTSMAEWEAGIEKEMIADLRKAGPKEAPKGFFNPGVKGPTYVHLSIPDIARSDFKSQQIDQQSPSVLFLYPFQRIVVYTPYSTADIPSRLDQAMKYLSERSYPAFAMTPFWYNEDGQRALGEKGKRYARCKEIAEMTRAAAAKYGVAVIDLFAMCEQEHAADPSKVYWGVNEADPKTLTMRPDGKDLYRRAMQSVLGIAPEE